MKSGTAPSDEIALEVSGTANPYMEMLKLTYQTLTVFFNCVLAKRYTNPSSDIITVLAGLDHIDSVFSEFANTIEMIIRTGRTCMLLVPSPDAS